jgi:hypothetical protein
MRFRYERYDGPDGLIIERPVIPITLYNPLLSDAPSVGYHALVDSGADYCVFSAEIADMLGIDITTGEEHAMSSAFVGDGRSVFFHPIEITVGPYGSALRLPIWAGFMQDLRGTGYGVLGRHSFFNGLTFIKFRNHLSELEIGKRRK